MDCTALMDLVGNHGLLQMDMLNMTYGMIENIAILVMKNIILICLYFLNITLENITQHIFLYW